MGAKNDKPANYLLLDFDCAAASHDLAERIVTGAVIGKGGVMLSPQQQKRLDWLEKIKKLYKRRTPSEEEEYQILKSHQNQH